jgi:predicted amidohydrolase
MSPPTAPQRLRVAAAQMVFAKTLAGNVAQIADLARQARRRRADVVLFPECATTGYAYDFPSLRPPQIREALNAISAIAKQHAINLLVGSPVPAVGSRKWHNALVAFDRGGRQIARYAKCQLHPADRPFFTPGDALALFDLDGVTSTAILCHERRYPELVRLPVMCGAQVIFHPNAGMDAPAVSKAKRNGKDGIPVRAFENAVYYVFANSVGPQGSGKWSAGDSKIVAPDGTVLAQADNATPGLIIADLDLSKATRKYAVESAEHPKFLAKHWRAMAREVRRRAKNGFTAEAQSTRRSGG